MTPRKTAKYVLTAALVATVVAVLVVGVHLGSRWRHRAARQSQRANQMKQIGMALHNYHDAFRTLPPAFYRDRLGSSAGSWRAVITPFVAQGAPTCDPALPWYDPANRELGDPPGWFRVYSLLQDKTPPARLDTNIVAVTGRGTAFDGDRAIRIGDIDADNVLLVELADSGVHWAEPGDLSVDDVPQSITTGMDGRGVHVLFADGRVWFLRRDVPLEDLRKFFTVEGARRFDREKVLGPYASY